MCMYMLVNLNVLLETLYIMKKTYRFYWRVLFMVALTVFYHAEVSRTPKCQKSLEYINSQFKHSQGSLHYAKIIHAYYQQNTPREFQELEDLVAKTRDVKIPL